MPDQGHIAGIRGDRPLRLAIQRDIFRQKLGDRCAVWDGEGAQLLVILNLCLSRLRLGQRLEGLPFLLSVALPVHVGVDHAISVVP